MAFEAFPSEAVEQFNDPGPYYVRENGKLRSPPGMGPHDRRSLLESGQTTIPAMMPVNSTSTNRSENTPRKLFDLTLDFVAANIVLVDSLVGFPEVVGQQLFEASHRHGNLSINALRLFSDAYGGTILRSVNLSGHHLAVNQYSNCLAVFPYLTELEVGGCRLGDDHEIISTIANCHSLTRLGLASNSLSDAGIQRLTVPLRVMGRGPRNLSILDLAGNYLISDKSARRYLTIFASVQAIDLSGCSITSVGLDVLKTKLRLKINNTAALSPFYLPVQTSGWALPLIEQWVSSSTAVMARGKRKANIDYQAHGASTAVSFYGRARKQLENVSRSFMSNPKPPIFPVIQLVAATTDHNQPTSDPADKVKRSKGKIDYNTNQATCRQEVEACQSKNGVLSRAKLDKEIIEQYAISLDGKSHKNKLTAKRHWSFLDLESDDLKDSKKLLAVKQEPIKFGKPPPKKRIKLSDRASTGFSDVLGDQKVEGRVHGEPRLDQKSLASQQASDWRKSGDHSHMTLKSCSSRDKRLHRERVVDGKEHRKRTIDHGENVLNDEDCVHSKQAKKQKENSLWNAMNSENWG